MFNCNCNCKCTCTAATVIAGAIIGVLAAFLQITGVIALTPLFLGAALGIAVVYLGVLLLTAALAGRREGCCTRLTALLVGILGTVLLSVILLAAGITATVVGAILVGLLLFFLTLVFGGAACLIRCLLGCGDRT